MEAYVDCLRYSKSIDDIDALPVARLIVRPTK